MTLAGHSLIKLLFVTSSTLLTAKGPLTYTP